MNENPSMSYGFAISVVRGNQGSSLLEVLIAMVLVSVVILGIAGFSTISINGTAFSKKMTIAVTLAQDKLEDIRRVGYRPSLSGVVTELEPYGSIDDLPQFERTVITKANTPASGLQTVVVKVTWDANSHSTLLSTILAE